VPELIAATSALAKDHPAIRLEIVGDNRTYPAIDLEAVVAGHGMGDRTRIRSFVSDAALTELYAAARAFVFLSDYEGFGLTPLEALSCGVPVLVGDTPVAREVYGDAAEYVSTTDTDMIARRLKAVLFDEELRQARLSAAETVSGRYSWERTALATLEVLAEAAR
jgi:glycosyltransferase involved in cell wall biosynthesis